nr:MAG TPA: hypothetical protein [Caudoviricetes sp.]DAY03725.1 MAG TPA: hypothetical protein [Bacteriophage sp.]
MRFPSDFSMALFIFEYLSLIIFSSSLAASSACFIISSFDFHSRAANFFL